MLSSKERYFLKKEDRLKSRKIIEKLFKSGKSFSNFPFRILWLPENHIASLQAGVGVSSRFFKKATDRNHIKRLMRESYRLQKNVLQQDLITQKKELSVFILFTGKEIPVYHTVYEKMGVILNRLSKLMHEEDQPHIK